MTTPRRSDTTPRQPGAGDDDRRDGEIVVFCPDQTATRALASRLAAILQPGDVVLLEGDLGAGKTAFTQGLASALGVESEVTSPTFTLMNIYATTAGFDLVHVDVYRLERLSEVVDLALPEMIEDGAVAVVEWGERAAAALPGPHLFISIERGGPEPERDGPEPETVERGDEETSRTFRLRPSGAAWDARRPRLASIAGGAG